MTYQNLQKTLKHHKDHPVIRIKWLDAVFHIDRGSEQEMHQEQGGTYLYVVGHLVSFNKRGLTLCGELDECGDPSRDFNTIPISLIEDLEIMTRSTLPWV